MAILPARIERDRPQMYFIKTNKSRNILFILRSINIIITGNHETNEFEFF